VVPLALAPKLACLFGLHPIDSEPVPEPTQWWPVTLTFSFSWWRLVGGVVARTCAGIADSRCSCSARGRNTESETCSPESSELTHG
jgi:hypothetical protein